jgi:hypothetical protein
MVTQAKELDNKAQAATDSNAVTDVDTAVGASFMACGIGSTFFGLAVIGAEMNEAFKNAINLNAGVGPLSGKAAIGVTAFILSWIILHFVMRGKNIPLKTSFIVGIVLTLLGVLFTYPPFFLLFAPA